VAVRVTDRKILSLAGAGPGIIRGASSLSNPCKAKQASIGDLLECTLCGFSAYCNAYTDQEVHKARKEWPGT
jgi:hypothetical protein